MMYERMAPVVDRLLLLLAIVALPLGIVLAVAGRNDAEV